MEFDAFSTSKHGEGKSLLKIFFAILISTLRRFNRANKKICHIHFKDMYGYLMYFQQVYAEYQVLTSTYECSRKSPKIWKQSEL